MSLINISHLSFSYPESLTPVFEDLSLKLDTNWRLGLIGRNGRGKTTLLRLLLGEMPYSGTISNCANFVYFHKHLPIQRCWRGTCSPGSIPSLRTGSCGAS